MGRSRSRSCGRWVPPSVYCKKKKKRRGSRKSRHRRRRSRRRSKRRCGSRGSRGSRRRRSRRSRSRRGRRCRPGRKTNNPFLNYLRVFRKKHCGWPQCKIAIEGAKCWCKMSNPERQKFYNEACSMRKGKRRKGGRRKRRRGGRSSGRRRKRSRRGKRGHKKSRCL